MGRIARRHKREPVLPGCCSCSGEQVSEVLLGCALVLRCVDCDALSYVQRRSVRSRICGALLLVIEFCAPTANQTGTGTWIIYP